MPSLQNELEKLDDPNQIAEFLKLEQGLRRSYPKEEIATARKIFEDTLLPQMAGALSRDGIGNMGFERTPLTEEELRKKIWEEPNLGDHLLAAENALARGFASVLLGSLEGACRLAETGAKTAGNKEGESRARSGAEWAKGWKENFQQTLPPDPRMHWASAAAYGGAGEAPAQLATALYTPVNAAANFAQVYGAEFDRMHLAELEKEFEADIRHGTIPKSTPRSQWEKELSPAREAAASTSAAWRALCVATPSAAVQTLAEKFLVKNVPWDKLPGGKALRGIVDRFLETAPSLPAGARIFGDKAGRVGLDSLATSAQTGLSNIGQATITGDTSNLADGIKESVVAGLAAGGTMAGLNPNRTAPQKFEVDTATLRFGGRDVTQVILENGKEQGFYRSSGRNSGMPDQWLPFDGIACRPNGAPWFDKTAYVETHPDKEDGLHRYGTPELKAIGEKLDTLNLPHGEEGSVKEINDKVSTDPSHPAQKNQDGWDNRLQYEAILTEASPPGMGPTPREGAILECDGISTTLARTPDGAGQAFCRDAKGEWWPISGIGIQPDGTPRPITEMFHGAGIPKNLKGYGTEEIKALAESLKENPPRGMSIAAPASVNNWIERADPKTEASGHNLTSRQTKEDWEQSPGIRPATPADKPTTQALPQNKLGRDLIIGDLRGCLPALNRLLEASHFNPKRDRVFCTGNLSDPTQKSPEALQLLERPWFHAVKGTQESAIETALNGFLHPTDKDAVSKGATALASEPIPRWISAAMERGDRAGLSKVHERLANMPIILKVGEGPERFHIVHSSLNPGETAQPRILTNKEIDNLAAGKTALTQPSSLQTDEGIAALIQKDTIQRANRGAARETSTTYCGHNTTENPRDGAHIMLDTGAGKQMPGAALSLIDHKTGKGLKAPTAEEEILWIDQFAIKKQKGKQEEPEEPKKTIKKEDPSADAMNPLPVARGDKKKVELGAGLPFF